MTAFYVVGIDLELWFGIHLALIRKQDIVIGLVCIGFLCIGTHQDMPVKSTGSLVIEYSLEQLGAHAIGHGMVDRYIIIYMLPAVGKEQSKGFVLTSFCIQCHMGIVPDYTAMKGDGVGGYIAVRLLVDIQVSNKVGVKMFVLDTGIIKMGSRSGKYLGDRIGQEPEGR